MKQARAADGGPVEIRLAGMFRVARGGVPLGDYDLGSKKERTLLKLLAVHRPALVPADRIADVLWPGEQPSDPGRNIATLVSRLRGTLGAAVILGDPSGYRLAGPSAVTVDLDEVARLITRAERELADTPGIALTEARHAITLLAPGPALAAEPDAAWAQPARTELDGLLRRARHAAAEAATAVGDQNTATTVAADAMAADPFDESAYRLYMTACAADGEPAKALACYAALKKRLADELGADPARQTRDLHVAILREQPHTGHPMTARVPRPRAGQPLPDSAFLPGRDTHLAELIAAWERAVSGEPGVLLLVGEAGIGKTVLAEAFASEVSATGATVLRARCYEAERSLFLQPVLESLLPVVTRMPPAELRELLGTAAPSIAALMPEAAAVLGQAHTSDGRPATRRTFVDLQRRRAFQSVAAFLSGLAARDPVLVVLDDLQYAGQSTAEFLHYLARHAGPTRLMAVATLRAENEAETAGTLAGATQRLEIGPLNAAAVQHLARRAGQAAHAERILRQTRGHTLFVVETLRSLVDGDDGLPESLRSAVQGRAGRAGPDTEQLLLAAAVLGAAVDPAVVAALLDLPAADALRRCELACQARLLLPAGRVFEFANDLIRDALYASLPEPVRVAHHQKAAELLTSQPESLAYHAAASGDHARASRAWLTAAEGALRRFAASDAVDLATQSLGAAERAGDLEVIARARVLRGRAREARAEFAAALDDFREGRSAAQAAGDTREEMLALRHLGGDVPVNVGLPASGGEEPLTRGLRLAGLLGDRTAEADLLTRLAVIATHRLRFDLALRYGQRGAAAGRAGDATALSAGLDGLKTALGCLGRSKELAAVLDELQPLARRSGDPFLLVWTTFESAYCALAEADWDRAADAMWSAIDINQRVGYPDWATWHLAHLGWLARVRGRAGEAAELGRRAVEASEARTHPWLRPATCAALGSTLLAAGSRTEAIGLLESGAAAGEPGRARKVLAPLLGALQRVSWPAAEAAALLADGQALTRLGQRARADKALARGIDLAARHGLDGVATALQHHRNGAAHAGSQH
jgi:DNA-binding SARP family transcriptional activator/tetratricopeptide (TPR) repeat protein